MTTCLVIAAVISCTTSTPKPTPHDAVRVLTSSVTAFVAAPPIPSRVERDLARYRDEHTAHGGMPPATPIKPLSEPWRVTTVVTPNRGVQTWFNGQLIR